MSPEASRQLDFDSIRDMSHIGADEFVAKVAPLLCDMEPDAELLLHPEKATPDSPKIGCTYPCYVFANKTGAHTPAIMTREMMVEYADRIAEHADAHDLRFVRVIFHGGEALLLPNKVDEFATILHERVPNDKRKLVPSVVTNGIKLTQEKVDMLKKHNFAVVVSLDGDRIANDRHRHDRMGKSTFDRVLTGIDLLRKNDMPFGIQTVIDPRNNPEETLEFLASLGPQTISMFPSLIRDPEIEQDPKALSIGEWQRRAFVSYRDWGSVHNGELPAFRMPIYDEYIRAFDGAGKPRHEKVANRLAQEMFMYPDGWGRVDTLDANGPDLSRTGMNPVEHSVDEVLRRDPSYIARRGGAAILPKECQVCPLVEACGGDYYPHRGDKELLAQLTAKSTSADYARAYSKLSPLCEDQKILLYEVAAAVEVYRGYAPGSLTARVEIPDFVNDLIPSAPVEVKANVEFEIPFANASVVAPELHALGFGGARLVAPGRAESQPGRAPRALVQGSFSDIEREMVDKIASRLDREVVDWLNVGCPAYEVFPMGNTRDPSKWHLTPNNAVQMLEAVKAGELSGRLGAYAYQVGKSVLSHAHYAPPVAFYGAPYAPNKLAQVSTTVDSKFSHHSNMNDAIVTALLNENQPALRDISFKLAKIDGYWLTTGNAVRALAAQVEEVSGTLATLNTHDEAHIKVGFVDLPSDMLVLDMPAASPEELSQAFDEVTNAFWAFSNPEQLSLALSKREAPIHLRPFKGAWPGAYRTEHWQRRPATDLIGAAAASREPVTLIPQA
jgi:uncharacterized protein